jgi:hypothetical protein
MLFYRGLPHAHIAVAFDQSGKINSGREADLMISAEIPDPKKHPILHRMVLHHNVHVCRNTPGDPSSCIQDGCCKKNFPYGLREHTVLVDGSYPLYRRRNQNPTTVQKRGRNMQVTDSMIVPYNPAITLLLDCHVNVQACSQIFDFKYMFKYFTKEAEATIFYPHDPVKTEQKRALYRMDRESIHAADEINLYKVGRFLQTSECLWTIFSFELYYLSQPVVALPIHLINEQDVMIIENKVTRLAERTMLTSFFELNEHQGNDAIFLHPSKKIKDLLYIEVPQYCAWDGSSRMWVQRVRKSQIQSIGRLQSPYDGQKELWSLRLLLMNRPGPTSFEDLLLGAANFTDSAANHGLLDDNTEYEKYMKEVTRIETPAACRQIFADLLIAVAVPNAVQLWDDISRELSDDFLYRFRDNRDSEVTTQMCLQHALWCVNDCLVKQSFSLKQFGFPSKSYCRSVRLAGQYKPSVAIGIVCTEECEYDDQCKEDLNADQLKFINAIEAVIQKEAPACMLLQAPGGTGKTYTMNVAIKMMLNAKLKLAVTSSTGECKIRIIE